MWNLRQIDYNKTVELMDYLDERGIEYEESHGRIYVGEGLRITYFAESSEFYRDGRPYVDCYGDVFYTTEEELRNMINCR